MRKLFNLLAAEVMKYYNELRRYLFNTVSGLITFFIIFIAIFFGIRFFAGPSLSMDKLDGFIVGYLSWTFAMMGFFSLSYFTYDEIERGTLEQLYLCSLGTEWIFLFRTILEFLFTLTFSVIILFFTMLVTNRWLSINGFKVLPVLLISLPGIWGFGFMSAGLVLLYKKVSSFMQIFSFALIGLVSVEAPPLSFFSFFPFATGSTMIQGMIRKGMSYDAGWHLFTLAVSAFYLFLGYLVYKLCETRARRRNLLSQY